MLYLIHQMLRSFIGLYQVGRTTPCKFYLLGVAFEKAVNLLQKVANATFAIFALFDILTNFNPKLNQIILTYVYSIIDQIRIRKMILYIISITRSHRSFVILIVIFFSPENGHYRYFSLILYNRKCLQKMACTCMRTLFITKIPHHSRWLATQKIVTKCKWDHNDTFINQYPLYSSNIFDAEINSTEAKTKGTNTSKR